MKFEREVNELLERRKLLKALRNRYEPHEKQKLILKAIKEGHKQIFVRAGRQSGKTQQSCDLAWLTAGLGSNSVCSIITPSLKQAKKIYWKKGTIQRFGPKSWTSKVQNDDLTIFFNNGSYIEVDGSDNIDAHRGDKKDLVILDEYKDIDPEFYPEVIEPMFATTGGIVVIIGTPPKEPESHFKELEMFAQNDPDWKTVHWTSYDSPYTSNAWLDKKRAQLEGRGELDIFKREYLAEYTIGGKDSVFPMFARATHMRSIGAIHKYFHRVKDRCELYWVSDPATSSTFASLFIAYYREKGQILVLDEIYQRNREKTHTEAIVDEAKAKIAPFEPNIQNWQVIFDDAEAWFGNELLHGHKIAAFPAGKAAVEKEEGIALMKSLMLQKNSTVISEACQFFPIEIENYITKDGKYPKIGDHAIDCFRYFQTYAHVVLSLAEGGEIDEDREEFFDHYLEHLHNQTDLPSWIQ